MNELKLTNTGRRRLGILGRPALIIEAGQSVPITEQRLEEIKSNRTSARWLERGILTVSDGNEPVKVEVDVKPTPPVTRKERIPQPLPQDRERDKREEVELPEGVEGTGTELHHAGGGWWEVYVNGFKVTDRKVRKDEAESIAEEYD